MNLAEELQYLSELHASGDLSDEQYEVAKATTLAKAEAGVASPARPELYDCPACGHQVSKIASSCPSCGHTMETSYYRERFRHFDEAFGTLERARAATPLSASSLAGDTRRAGARALRSWNWAAALFGVLWYFWKGLWLKGLLLLVFGLFMAYAVGLGPLAGVFIGVIAGIGGDYDLYRLRRFGSQW